MKGQRGEYPVIIFYLSSRERMREQIYSIAKTTCIVRHVELIAT